VYVHVLYLRLGGRNLKYRLTRGKIWIEFGLRAIQILSRPDIEIPLFPTNRSPIAIQPCAGSGGVPKVPSVRAKGGGEFAFSLVGHSKPHANQPACTVALGGLLALQISALAPPRPAGGIARSSRRFHDHVWGLRRPRPRSRTPSTAPLAQPLHQRPTSAASCGARSGTASRSACAITSWALEWLADPENQRSTAPSTPLAQPLHLRPTSAASCSARSGPRLAVRRDHVARVLGAPRVV